MLFYSSYYFMMQQLYTIFTRARDFYVYAFGIILLLSTRNVNRSKMIRELNFHNYCLVYTDGSVSTNSAGFSFFIPEKMVKYSDTLPHFMCSFTAKCYAITTALEYLYQIFKHSKMLDYLGFPSSS